MTEYLDLEMLRQLQRALSSVAGRVIRIACADGTAYLSDGDDPSAWQEPEIAFSTPVIVGGDLAGHLQLTGPDRAPSAPEDPKWLSRFMKLMAHVIGRLCEREQLLRSRAEEMAMLYRLTAEFTGQRDLQSVLDLVARTVVEVLGVKGCMIRLLSDSGEELLVKAVYGLSREYLDKGPLRVADSQIDQEVIRTLRPVYVRDQRKDSRIVYPVEARDEGIVSALCAPLVYHGRAEGVLRVYTRQVHQFNWFETSLLEAIGAQAAAAIVNARLNADAAQSEEMRRQLALAGEVQREMIPAGPPSIAGFDIGAVYVPSMQLSGDFYDFIPLEDGNLGLAICDVVGKGVRASLLMASIRASLRAHAVNIYDMATVMKHVNRDLCADSLISDFATMFYGVLDTKSLRLTYSNAGHPPPVLIRDGHPCRLTTGGTVLGVDPDRRYNTEAFQLKAGDVVMAFTDGLPEALNFQDESFGMARVEQSLQEAAQMDLSAEGIVKHVVWNMRKFAGLQRRFDDLTLVAFRVL
ncbi:MAG: PP2C family protein-serine/threonine phosphatase [Phycisphaerae bacterium]